MIEIAEMYLAPQGEGPNLGRLSLFVRTRRCTLHCTWCDSKFSWDKNDPDFQEYGAYSPPQLTQAMLTLSQYGELCHAVVLTGGEPLIWQRELYPAMLNYRSAHRCPIEVETSGTIIPSDDMLRLCNFIISHKLSSAGNSGVAQRYLWREDVVKRIISVGGLVLGNVCFKPVVGPGDEGAALESYLGWLSYVGRGIGLSWERLRECIYLMPQATTADQLSSIQEQIIELAQKYGVRCTTRLQILAYGNERRR